MVGDVVRICHCLFLKVQKEEAPFQVTVNIPSTIHFSSVGYLY